MSKYSQDLINKVHGLKESGKTFKKISSDLQLSNSQVHYIIYKLKPKLKPENLQEIFDQANVAVKEADTILKRIKRLLFGS